LTGGLKVWVSGAGIDVSLRHIEVDSVAHVAPYSDPKGTFFLEAKQPKHEAKNHLYLLPLIRMLRHVLYLHSPIRLHGLMI